MRGERGRRPSPLAELLAWMLSLSIVMGCATVVPPTRGTIRTPDLSRRIPSPRPAAVAVVGDVGTFVPGVPDLARAIRDRLRGAPAAPLLILGDVFYTDGLLGVCHELGDPPRSKQGCEKPTSPEDQLALVRKCATAYPSLMRAERLASGESTENIEGRVAIHQVKAVSSRIAALAAKYIPQDKLEAFLNDLKAALSNEMGE